MEKILFCLTSLTRANGISKFIMSYYPYISKKVHIDFLLAYNTVDKDYKTLIENNGSNIYVIDCPNKLIRATYTKRMISRLIKENKYTIIHVNMIQQYALGCIYGAKKLKIRNIIYHVHAQYTIHKLSVIRNIINDLCIKNATKLVACSISAGKSNFKKKEFDVIRNAIDFKIYKFSEESRKKYRKDLGLEDKYVIGVVGRICMVKNPYFIINILEEIIKSNKNAVLVWVGNGEPKAEKEVKNYVSKKRLDKNVIFLGSRSDVGQLYSAFDVFLLPSKYEGLGIVFLEAQASGLISFASSNVPRDVECTDLIHFLPINNNVKYWADMIVSTNETLSREQYNDLMINGEYYIQNNIDKILQLYNYKK